MAQYLKQLKIGKFLGLNTQITDLRELGIFEVKGENAIYSPDSLNWITLDNNKGIELRRGTKLLGTTLQTGAGKITGLGVGNLFNGKQVPFFTFGRKMMFYNEVTDDVEEIGTDTLPVAADGEEVSIFPYQNLAGAFVYFSSPNSGIYKIPTANPGSVVKQKTGSYRGFLKFGQSRSLLFNRNGDTPGNKDQMSVYASCVDKVSYDQYTGQKTGEVVGTGDGATKHFSKTLTEITGNRTAMFAFIGGAIDNGVSISAISKADLAVVTAAGHSLVVGDNIIIVGGDMTQINSLVIGVYAVNGNDITLAIKSTAFTTYTTGGKIYKVEYFNDDLNGNLTSNLGGTGTINYSTGAVDITFNTIPTNLIDIFAQYSYEDATDGGVCDFNIAQADDRQPGEGNIFPQFDGGGNINAVCPLSTVFYCFHDKKTWQVIIPVDDESGTDSVAVNLPFREKMGVKSKYGAFGGAQAIYFLNTSDPNKPEFMRLELYTGATSANIAQPTVLSNNIDFSPFGYDDAQVKEWGNYVFLACAQMRQGLMDEFNSRLFVYNKNNGAWDLLDYPASKLEEYNGTLIAGDSVSNNVFTLFSGFDDEDNLIDNHYETGEMDLTMEGLKRFTRFSLEGLIVGSQAMDVEMAFDGGTFVKVAEILGNGAYVDTAKSISVGSETLGAKVVGGGATVFANPFEAIFRIQAPLFEYVRVRFKATGGGYISINNFCFHDIRQKSLRKLNTKTIN
jgi:hypothetical protein